MLVNHPDKNAAHPNRTRDNAKAVQLNELKEFLCDFDPDSPHIWRRIAELFRRGKDGRASSSRGHVPRPTVASPLARPGSSPSNPIVIDAPGVGAPASLPVGPSNRKGKTRAGTELRRQCRNRRSSYYPSRAPIRVKDGWASTWNPWLNPRDPAFQRPVLECGRHPISCGRGHVPHPTPASALTKPGSSPSNPIVIDALEIGGTASLAVGSLNRKGKPRIRTKLCRQHRNHRSSYHPSQASGWRPAPYADQSDTDLGWS